MYRVTIEQHVGCEKHLVSQHDYYHKEYAELDAEKLASNFEGFDTEILLDTPARVDIRVIGQSSECIISYTFEEVA